jgi:type VI secretion system protein VasG
LVRILTNSVLPAISRRFLERTAEGGSLQRVHINAVDSEFAYAFDSP